MLKRKGVHYIGDLVAKTENELKKTVIPWWNQEENLKKIKDSLEKINLHLGMNIYWPASPESVKILAKRLIRHYQHESIEKIKGLATKASFFKDDPCFKQLVKSCSSRYFP